MIIIPIDFPYVGINLEAGLYLRKITSTSTSTSDDVTTTTVGYISKIEFVQQHEPVIVPISKMWLPRDLSGGDIEIATNEKVGGVKNPNSYTESSDDVTAYVQSDGLIKVPVLDIKNALTSMPARHIILESTTSGSTKKFKITVDDSGALKATEVTS